MTDMLTVIITTYNSERTIRDCLNSVFRSNLMFIDEIVVCDDASSDNTLEILENFRQKYHFLKIVKHDENRGGGAARNTAIQYSKNEYLYILDSDDLIHPNSLTTLFLEIFKSGLSGVHYGKAYYFLKSPNFFHNIENYFSIFGNKITFLQALRINKLCVNFLFTREAWKNAGGYPEDYSWDTQGFTLKFLMNNDSIKVIENTKYYHRKFIDRSSYYNREEDLGRNKINSWLVIENVERAITDKELYFLISSDFFSKNEPLDLIQKSINSEIDISINEKLIDEFRLSIRAFAMGEYDKSKFHAENALKFLPNSFILKYNLHRSELVIAGCDPRKVKLQAFDQLQKDNSLFTNKTHTSKLIKLKYYVKSIFFPIYYLLSSRGN